MSSNFKPEGYNALSPYMIVNDVKKMTEFLSAVFDAIELRKYETPQGIITHVEYKIDDSVVMMSQANPQFPANKFLLHVYVPDVHGTIKKARENGCRVIQEPVAKDDGDTRGMFIDLQGNTWAVGQVASSK